MRSSEGHVLTPALDMHFLELPKLQHTLDEIARAHGSASSNELGTKATSVAASQGQKKIAKLVSTFAAKTDAEREQLAVRKRSPAACAVFKLALISL